MKFYFDTSIWLDIVLDRGNNGKVAKELLEKIAMFGLHIVYSDVVITEFKKLEFSDFEINEILNLAKPNNIYRIHSTKDQHQEAKKIYKEKNVPFRDVLHAIISRDSGAQLISRDKDFKKLKDITNVINMKMTNIIFFVDLFMTATLVENFI